MKFTIKNSGDMVRLVIAILMALFSISVLIYFTVYIPLSKSSQNLIIQKCKKQAKEAALEIFKEKLEYLRTYTAEKYIKKQYYYQSDYDAAYKRCLQECGLKE
ncbi:MAG: hypothetical protein KBB01_03320 [Candidatus Omnitrophica bacterium]|jgi:hypothetical protein|nr:hypothetical protein [Candidatus Omnitrophota bacterium]